MLQRFIFSALILGMVKVSAQAPQHIQMWNEVFANAELDAHSGDEFGFSVSVDNQFGAVGAPSHDFAPGATAASNLNSPDFKEDAGAVYVYEKFGSYWRNPVKLVAPDRQEFDRFGASVVISGTLCVVGAPGEDHDNTGTSSSSSSQAGYLSNSGSVYVFSHDGTNWNFVLKFTAPNRAAEDQFGANVSIMGSRLFVAAPLEDEDESEQNTLLNSGSVYGFALTNGSWLFEQKIVASDRAAGDEFGSAIDFDGTTLLVGARFADISGNANQGAAYAFQLISSLWTAQGKIVASDGGANDFFGAAVGVHNSNMVLGSPGNLNRGAAYTYHLTSGTWVGEQKVIASDIQVLDQFGSAVSIYSDTLMVGAPGEDHDQTGTSSSGSVGSGYLQNSGSAYVFYRVSVGWGQSQKLTLQSRSAQANFGHSVDVFKEDCFFGAPYQSVNSSLVGSNAFFGKDVYVWTGASSADPTDVGNWKEGAVPPTDHDFLFTSGTYNPSYVSALYANRVTILPNVELSISAPNVIRADGSIYNDGTIKLLASNNGTYSSLFFRGDYFGTGTVFKEQHLGIGWHQISTPFQNTWAAIQGGASSALVPFDAATGNYATQGSLLGEVGRGYFAQVTAAGAYGTGPFMASAGKFSAQGVPNTACAFQLAYSNNSTPTNVQHTTAVVDGWNLLGNPFTAPLDFRFLGRTNVDPYYSIWDPTMNGGLGGHKFYSYVGGTLSWVIPPMQAFWVRATTANPSIDPATMSFVGTISSVPKLLKNSRDDFRFSVVNSLDTTFYDHVWITEDTTGMSASNIQLEVPKQFAPSGSINMFLDLQGNAIAAKGIRLSDTLSFQLVVSRPTGIWQASGTGRFFDLYDWKLEGIKTGAEVSLVQDVTFNLSPSDTIFNLTGVKKTLGVPAGESSKYRIQVAGDLSLKLILHDEDNYEVEAVSLSGQRVAFYPIVSEVLTISVPSSGVYIIRIRNVRSGIVDFEKVVLQ
jgi:hypothetical protein